MNNKGFTLIEILIAMSIFVIFMGVLIGSYAGIISSQRDANNYRAVYEEGREVFDELIEIFRENVVDYGHVAYRCRPQALSTGLSSVHLISKDGRTKTQVLFEEGVIRVKEGDNDFVDLNSDAAVVEDFKVYVYPYVDPYDPQYVYYDAYQFQPKITFVTSFEPFGTEFRTSVSSKLYNQVYPTERCLLVL